MKRPDRKAHQRLAEARGKAIARQAQRSRNCRRAKNPMGRFQPPEPSIVWLTGLIEAMEEVASSAAQAPATDREALANRLGCPATAQMQTGRALP